MVNTVNSPYYEALVTSILLRYMGSFVITEVIYMNNASCGPKKHFFITLIRYIRFGYNGSSLYYFSG